MRALYFDQTLHYQATRPEPTLPQGEALIRTRLAGICNTDLEIVRGYMGFRGVLGHEFVGEVVQANGVTDLIGQRVVGEINAYCGECVTCRRGDPTQCPHRTTLGIVQRDGTMADYFTLPLKLLYPVPDSVPDEWAVFTEPLAAACQILEQVHIRPTDRVVVLGDGKLGLLIAQVLQLTGCQLTVIGRHANKLAILAARGIRTQLADEVTLEADIVVEATGSPSGFALARKILRPRGTLVLKSTYHGDINLNLSMVVVDEIKLIGSRCGPFAPALRLLEQRLVDVTPLIHDTFSLNDGLAAFEQATAPGVLKVLLAAM
jgi:alcohol dehydrogenase